MSLSKTTAEFIRDAILVHGDRYDYSKVKYLNNKTPVIISCPIHGDFKQKPNSHLNGSGCKDCGYLNNRKKIFGIGIYDGHPSSYKEDIHIRKRWMNILNRCYNKTTKFYIGCTVCEEWHLFSNFKEWFVNNYRNGYVIDKDIKHKGNKIYSPNTCLCIPPELNALFTNRKNHRGKYPIGVTKVTESKTYQASLCLLNGKHKYLGTFDTKEDAFMCYKMAKEELIKTIADKYYKDGLISDEARQSMCNYRIEITD